MLRKLVDTGTPLAHKPPRRIGVTEATSFERQAKTIWSDDERHAFIDFISLNPEAGALIPGTGGLRKVRWSARGAGKRGGARVIYYYFDEEHPLYLLMIFAKSRKTDMSPAEKRSASAFAAELKRTWSRND